jgi:hypothetical protein
MDGQTKLTATFRNFANAPNNQITEESKVQQKDFSLLQTVQTGSEAHPISSTFTG